MGGPATHVATVDGCATTATVNSTASAMEAATATSSPPPAAATSTATLGIEFTSCCERYQTGQEYLANVFHDVTLLMLKEEEEQHPTSPWIRGGGVFTWLPGWPGEAS